MLLRPADFERLLRNYRSDRELDRPTAQVRDALAKLAKTAEAHAKAFAELPVAGRALVAEQVTDANGEVTRLSALSDRASTVAVDLTARMANGGRRGVLQVAGKLCPRARLLQGAKKALCKDMPDPRDFEVREAAERVLEACGVSTRGLKAVQYRLP